MTQQNTVVPAIDAVREKLSAEGFVVTNDGQLGIPRTFREEFHRGYFTEEHLRRYPDDVPEDRLRARDVLRYDREEDGRISIRSHHDIGIEGRGEHAGRREFVRTDLARDEHFVRWVRAVLSVIPVRERQTRGTFGVNLFRTSSKVVTRPHRDGEQFIVVYVVDKACGGGVTTLLDDSGAIIHKDALEPGDLIIFRDSDFLHSATELEAADGRPRRDALVCTVNYPGTYPLD
ncbi:2OG-Fe dioxygenase [Lentzea fradiae]|uniref:2OG-Fe dioxygenase n=1 Tax=Lentzea fradiae TaxID=200378 RepID=A0A1G7R6Z1_9PSEU|nr:2OG-Fe dioxygenase family protein [Lentzea fradiae]SDG05919.1 2OG-Fe dioxygenase [Lentzea fradiae]